jgi:hypothetical protein
MTLAAPLASERGTSVVEALVALLLTALLVQLTWSVVLFGRRAATGLLERSEALDTERVGWHVVSAELGAGIAHRDFGLPAGGVLPLRAFRGTAEVCPALRTADGGVVLYRGMRLPDAAKDSLLVLTAAGSWHALHLVSREEEAAACPGWPADAVERWRWEPPLDDVLLARVFERGSYHLEDRALRYSSGVGGRQPLTPERLEGTGSVFVPTAGRLDLRLRVRAEGDVVWESSRVLARVESPDD